LARALRASYAALDPVAGVRFATHLDARIRALGEPAVEWAEPPAAPDSARAATIDTAVPATSAVPPAGATGATAVKEETTVSTSTRERKQTLDDGRVASTSLDWR